MALFQRNVMPRITSSTDVRLRTVQVARRFNVVSRTIAWGQFSDGAGPTLTVDSAAMTLTPLSRISGG
jgi:hypothetical protein